VALQIFREIGYLLIYSQHSAKQFRDLYLGLDGLGEVVVVRLLAAVLEADREAHVGVE
jgi:hypothetical protein